MEATRAGKHQLLLLDWQPPLQVKYGAEGGRGLANVGPEKWPAIKSDGHFKLSEQ